MATVQFWLFVVIFVMTNSWCTGQRQCHYYLGNLGDGRNLGPPVPASDDSECCTACLNNSQCAAWTYTESLGECYLHPHAGRGVDSSSSWVSGVCLDDHLFDSPYELRDVPSISGVPLGGIGVGWFDISLDGAVSRVAINNWHEDGVITDTNATFLSVWRKSIGSAQLLQRRPAIVSPLIPPSQHAIASAAFPTINVTLSNTQNPDHAAYVLRAWSSLVPHDIANSSLPLAIIEVTVDNTASPQDDIAAVAFSWQDVIARRLFDANKTLLDAYYPAPGTQPCGWETQTFRDALHQAGFDVRTLFTRVATTVSPLTVAPGPALPPLTGLLQHTEPLQPTKFTLQHYVNQVAVLAEMSGSDDEISILPAFAVQPDAATAAWTSFSRNGTLPTGPSFPDTNLFTPNSGKEMASAISLRATVPAGSTRTFRFYVVWYAADTLQVAPGQDPRTFCGTSDYSKPYHAAFPSLQAVAAHAAQQHTALLTDTHSWQALLRQSSLPDWLSFKIINSAYTLYTNSILTKDGRFSMMEGGMGGLAGTMDQRMVAHIVYQKLFPALDAQELAQFAASQNPDGSINHFDAHFYAGITGTDGVAPLGNQQYTDNTIGWLYQVAKAYQITGDIAYIANHSARVYPAMSFLNRLRTAGPTFPTLISGSNTYDDFFELPLDAYLCSVYPLALEACRIIATTASNTSLADSCAHDRQTSTDEYVKALFNDQFFAYGAQLDGSGRADNILFGGQTAGPFLARHAGWGDVGASFERTQAALQVQLQQQVARSYSFYAPKVFNLTSGSRAIDPRNNNPSSTWPFYLESYTALAAIQAGFVDDGLAIARYIQLVNARLGLTWSQNLWNPGYITYVAAPVSWFAADVLSGAALDVPAATLWLSPVVPSSQLSPLTFPIIFPQAWLSVSVARNASGHPGGTLTVLVTKSFESEFPAASITRVAAAPVGTPAASAITVTLPLPWKLVSGALLDLSPFFDIIVAPILHAPVLPASPL